MTVVIDTPDGIEHFRMCQYIARLKLETSTGLHFRLPTLKYAREAYGLKSRTKKDALEELLTLYKERYGREYGRSDSPDGVG